MMKKSFRTQKKVILGYLREHESVTLGEAYQKLICPDAPQVIADLIADGHPITREWTHDDGRYVSIRYRYHAPDDEKEDST